MFTKIVLQEGVNLFLRNTKQFKTINVSVRLRSALDAKKNAHRAVLANVMQDSNSEYPAQSEFQKALDSLYGTVFYTDVAKRGDVHTFSLNAECVNDEYLSEEGVFYKVLDLISTTLFKPNFSDGNFDEDIVKREKRVVTERIRSVYDDKTRFAQKRMLELMRPDQPASISAYGTEAHVDEITSSSLKETYDSMLQSDEVDLYIVGDIDEEGLANTVKTLFDFKPRRAVSKNSVSEQNASDIRHIREKQDMKQGKLQVGFSTNITFDHPDFTKMQVMNGIFGGYAHSKLFMNVREKESMAYYVNSAYAAHYGLLYVIAGIDADLEEKAVSLIEEQVEALRSGDFTDLELNQTVAMLSNSIRSSFDSARGQIDLYDLYKGLDENFSADGLTSKWKQVTKEDVREMASTLKEEIVYLLSGREATQ